jgi:hypothetical protein
MVAIVQRHLQGWPVTAADQPRAADLEVQRQRALAGGAKQ